MSNTFMQIPDLPMIGGEDGSKMWIPIKSISQGITQEVSKFEKGKPRQLGKSDHNDFEAKKVMDKSSPFLYVICSDGRLISAVNFAFSRSDEKDIYLKMELKRVYIVELTTEVDDGEEPEETLKLNYEAIEWKYRPKLKGGKLGEWIQLGWDRLEYREISKS